MNSNQNIENKQNFSEEIEIEAVGSVEDFIRELEAKEKDLHISSELVIEFGDAEFDDQNIPDFVLAELPAVKHSAPAPPPQQPPKSPAVNPKTFSELEDELNGLKSQLSKMEAERAEIFENSRRRQKDFENLKTRTERERSETFSNQIVNLATQILPVLDNMNRALDFASAHSEGRSADFHQFFEGIVMVNQQLNEVLAEMGVSPIAAVGEIFDPHYHEAVAIDETGASPPQTISAELLKGYRVGDRVIRASMVKVAAPGKPAAKPDGNSAFSPANETNFPLIEIE